MQEICEKFLLFVTRGNSILNSTALGYFAKQSEITSGKNF